MAPDRGTTTLEIAFFANKKLVYLNKYGPDPDLMIPTFDVSDFSGIAAHLDEVFYWVEGEMRPREYDDSDSDDHCRYHEPPLTEKDMKRKSEMKTHEEEMEKVMTDMEASKVRNCHIAKREMEEKDDEMLMKLIKQRDNVS